jgi:phage/plasmid-like protein (TIGR03299 family)
MSKETLTWLNENVMYGCAAHRQTWGAGTSFGGGNKPWFADDQYKHLYAEGIPMADVIDTLFWWKPIEADISITVGCDIDDPDLSGMTEDGDAFKHLVDPDRKAIVRGDTLDILGVFGRDSYKVHDYEQWLLANVANLLDTSHTELLISSAGLLRKGGQAWVSIELPDDIEVAGAGHIRPCIIAATSLDGTLATTYATRIMRPECDNSLQLSLGAEGNTLKIKHSSKSMGRIMDARSALSIVYQMGETATAWYDALADVDVSDAMFRQIVAQLAPTPDPVVAKGKVTNQRAITNSLDKQATMEQLWLSDPRAAPWNGTLAGAFHAVSTFQQHEVSRDDVQIRRQMVGTLSGGFDKQEDVFWQVVAGLDIPIPQLVVAS